MNAMLRIVLVSLAVAAIIGLVGKQLGFDGAAYLASLFVGMFLVSLTDRDRFYAADLRRGQR